MINIGHLHPALVHLPIGFLILACLFYFLSPQFFSGVITPAVIRLCLLFGIIFAIPVVATGIIQAWEDQRPLKDVIWHVVFAVLSVLISILIYSIYNKPKGRLINTICFLALLICITLTGHFGGELTHGKGYLTTSDEQHEHHAEHMGNTTSSMPVTHVVEIKQMKFIPEIVTVNKGDTILFVNKDFLPHNVVESNSNRFSSPKLLPEEQWKLVADSDANYYCSYHMVMKGQIKVINHTH